MSVFREVVLRPHGQPPSGVVGHAYSIGWCADGKLAMGSNDGWVVLWDVEANGGSRAKSHFTAHERKAVEGLACSPTDKNQIATCCLDKTFKVWDVRSPNSPTQAYTTDGENMNIVFSPDGRYMAMGGIKRATSNSSETDILGIYDVRTQKKLKSVRFNSAVNDFVWSPNGEYIINASEKGSLDLMVFAGSKLARVRSPLAHTGGCTGMALDPYNRYLACGGGDGLVSMWELENFVCVRTIERCEAGIRSLSFSHDGQFLAVSSDAKEVEIAEVETGAHAHTIPIGFACSSLEWHPKRPILAGTVTRSRDFALRLWQFQY